MARLGAILKGRNVRCLSTTFVCVVFLTSLALLALQPRHSPAKTSMVQLPIEEVVKAQSIPELHPATGEPPTNGRKSWKKNAEKSGKNKANKELWLKDELPKKARDSALKSSTTRVETNSAETRGEGTTAEIEAVFKRIQDTAASVSPDKRQRVTPSTKRPMSLTKLSKTPLKDIDSPFIKQGPLLMPNPQEKIITWYKPEHVHQTNTKKKIFENCPESACKVVFPLSPDMAADAVIFNDMDPEDDPPERTHKDQVFVYHTMEPPSFPQPGMWPKSWNSAFNWTWTYRRDSDIWQPFGLLTKASKVPPLESFIKMAEGKDKAAAWMPQNCVGQTSSAREEFVHELKRRLEVSEFDGCHKNKSCSKNKKACSDLLSKKYFFLLALEEDMCKDHVTEIFYRAWQADTHVVPVVRGGTDYAAYFPEGTFIDADWFNTPKELADFLKKLMGRKKLYSQIVWRKAHWVRASKNSNEATFCQLCYRLHHLDSNRKVYPDMRLWFEESVCKFPRNLH